MAKLSKEEILNLAKLAKIDLTDDEVNKFGSEIAEILSYVEQLQTVDVSGLKPTYQVTGQKSVTRSDEVVDYQASPYELLKNIPKSDGRFIKVKRVL